MNDKYIFYSNKKLCKYWEFITEQYKNKYMVTIQTQKRTSSLYYIFLKFDRMFKECQQIIEK